MCFYTIIDYTCGDWKWGNMRAQCPHERRRGESCGTKLIDHDTPVKEDKPCITCQAILVKKRRWQKLKKAIEWRGSRFPNMTEKGLREMRDLEKQIEFLSASRISRVGFGKRAVVVMEPPFDRPMIPLIDRPFCDFDFNTRVETRLMVTHS